ncbi:magnesium transporter CorA family protein [Aerococcus agrisoli]|uniref:Magnesium transporter CorA family protein n=1 Tax=Aerococcus agrisoli TaxID=2487350 RepID=A0A3N4GP31_9LACT|nr:magnesium transporter CorA family protein [Aerococcus agrisoli]RPA60871.1 magnesium transporter CorA family protein [Aerococcus agrisoli]
MSKTIFHNDQTHWINLNSDNETELRALFEEYNLDDQILAYTLDKNERAHLDYDRSTNTLVLIFNVPNQTKIDNHYETIPMTFIITNQTLITITNKKNQYLYVHMKNMLARDSGLTLFEFLFSSLFYITDSFFPYIEEINSERVSVNNKLKQETTKKNLLYLSDLETGIVFLVSASKQNAVLLNQIKTHAIYKRLTEDEKEELDDALIEAKQLVEMTQLSSQILQQLSVSYNNVLNNNLNETIRILTVLSVLLTIPTIITGFFGMNVPLPLSDNPMAWIIIIAMSGIIWVTLSYVLKRIL